MEIQKPTTLPVSEVFYSLQMEGMTTGYPAVFVRLGSCNLLCNWTQEDGSTSACDTIEVWQNWNKKPIDEILGKAEIEALENGAHLIITGGEPLLHQKNLEPFLDWCHAMIGNVFIEVETNGTIMPTQYLMETIGQWNISPKLESSGNLEQLRLKPEVIGFFAANEEFLTRQFKFVITGQKDLDEIERDFNMIPKSEIVLMPAGATREELNLVRLKIVELCIKNHYRYSDRLHIVTWNQKTGV